MKNIYLIGMMGSGKTVIAEEMAKLGPWRSIDLDAAIVADSGRTIGEIFAEYGENYFRDLESNVLYDVHRLENLVVSTGGGVILRPRNVDLMSHSGLIVYIERNVDDIISTIDAEVRPLLAANPDNVRRIYEERRPLYEQAADVTVHNNSTVEDAAAKILSVASLSAL